MSACAFQLSDNWYRSNTIPQLWPFDGRNLILDRPPHKGQAWIYSLVLKKKIFFNFWCCKYCNVGSKVFGNDHSRERYELLFMFWNQRNMNRYLACKLNQNLWPSKIQRKSLKIFKENLWNTIHKLLNVFKATFMILSIKLNNFGSFGSEMTYLGWSVPLTLSQKHKFVDSLSLP